jgi:hypothetical protein
MIGTLQLLAYADVNLMGENINVVCQNVWTLLDPGKKVSLELKAKKTKLVYVFMSHHYTTGQNHDMKVRNGPKW